MLIFCSAINVDHSSQNDASTEEESDEDEDSEDDDITEEEQARYLALVQQSKLVEIDNRF